MAPIGCRKIPLNKHQRTLRNIYEELRPELHSGGQLERTIHIITVMVVTVNVAENMRKIDPYIFYFRSAREGQGVHSMYSDTSANESPC